MRIGYGIVMALNFTHSRLEEIPVTNAISHLNPPPVENLTMEYAPIENLPPRKSSVIKPNETQNGRVIFQAYFSTNA